MTKLTTPTSTGRVVGHGVAIGPLSAKSTGRHWIEPKHNLPIPTRVCAATAKGTLDLAHEWRGQAIRPGSDHSHIQSHGTRC